MGGAAFTRFREGGPSRALAEPQYASGNHRCATNLKRGLLCGDQGGCCSGLASIAIPKLSPLRVSAPYHSFAMVWCIVLTSPRKEKRESEREEEGAR